MLINILFLILILVLAVVFALLARAAWRSRFRVVRWLGVLLSGLLALVFIAVCVVAALGLVKLNTAPYQYKATNISVTGTPEQVEQGARKAELCVGCHSTTGKFPLDGSSENFLGGEGPPLGILYAPNLTPGGPLKDMSDVELARAMREGIGKNGRPLLVMPSKALHNLSDEDTTALIAFLRAQPAVERNPPERQTTLLAALLVGAGLFPTSAQPPIEGPIITPPSGTVEKGRYLVYSTGCIDCHGDNLAGIPPGGFAPSGPNLTAIVPKWNQQDLINLFRNGKDPTGRMISEGMPWQEYNAALDDGELKDMYTFLHGLEEQPANQ
ncbi:MAG: c-type cytochrome [Anaerolineaceae bacterium]|nr:c-type cytochrome [Anaerolineaceae bacterium]